MAKYDLLIRNGLVVFSDEVTQTDIAVKDGVIVKLESGMNATALEERDANGMYIFPGVIDVHVHFSEPGREQWEGFETGSKMMAAGGCTTFFDMPLNGIPSTINDRALLEKAEIGKNKSVVDFALWGGLVPNNEKDIKGLAENGAIGFKAFLSETGNDEFERADDYTLLNGMKEISSLGKVLALHAESAPITNWLQKEKQQKGLVSPDDYQESRPIIAEAEAVDRALAYAKLTGCALHFVHISSEAAIIKIEAAKLEGMDVTVETCPHYLLFSHQDLVEKGTIAKCAPPLRKKNEQERLLQLLIDGKFDMISSDHSPCPFSMKDPAVYNLFQAWGGISGGQFTLLSMIELAVNHNISLSRVAQWTSEAPANRFHLQSKGRIQVGMDADFAVVAMKGFKVTEDNFFAKHKQSLYLGHTFPCQVTATFNRGKLIFDNGDFIESGSYGKWLHESDIS